MIEAQELEMLERMLGNLTARHHGADLDAALEDLGFFEAVAHDPGRVVPLLFSLLGARNVASGAIGRVLACALLRPIDTALLPALGSSLPPAVSEHRRLYLNGISTELAMSATVLVVARDGHSETAFLVQAESLNAQPIAGMDPAMRLVRIEAQLDADATTRVGDVEWLPALTAGQLAIGHEMVAASTRMLELAVEHALHRVQSGRPIAAFQAVRHRLAETLVAIEAADSMLSVAWEERSRQNAAMAKIAAGRCARTAARHCQQVLAGAGFTTEHPFHLYLRRVLVLEQLLGSTPALSTRLGDEISQSRKLPDLIPL